jgi:hypothetical protein
MINRSSEIVAFIVIGIFVGISPVMGANFTSDMQNAKKFGTHEIVLVGNELVPNPFDTVATVTFTPPSGRVKAVTVRAFYDGGTTWRARVYVTEAGIWRWTSYSRADMELHGKSGSFNAEKSNLSGILRKNPSNPRAWVTDDGRWFLPISDTAWYLLHSQETLWQQYVRDDVGKGVNVLGPVGALGSPFTGPDNWGAGHSKGNNPWPGGASPEYKDYKRYDLVKFHEAERRIIWIFDNYPDMFIRSLLFGFEMQYKWSRLLPSVRRNTMDYMIARWSAFPNLFWLVSDDQMVKRRETLDFNLEVGSYFAGHEPWKHLMSTQPYRRNGFPLYTASGFDWVDYINIQDSNGPGAEQIRKYRFDGIPLHVMFGEDYYEQDHGDPPSGFSDPRFYVRWSFWSWILSGGSYTYGGRWGAIHPYSQTGRSDLAWTGAGKKTYTGYPLTGLDSVPYIGTYFKDREIDLGVFIPNDELVTDFSRTVEHAWRPKLMRRGTEEFLIYHPNAAPGSAPGPRGTSTATVNPAETASMKIDLTSAQVAYRVEWYRPHDGVVKSGGIVQGGVQRDFAAPWRGYDVVLRLTRVMN